MKEREALKRITRDDTEHGKEYYLASDVDALLAQPEKKFVTIVDGPFNHRCPETQLYITPPQRTWVGLTDEEMRKICGSVPAMREAVREAEAKLKAVNGFHSTEKNA